MCTDQVEKKNQQNAGPTSLRYRRSDKMETDCRVYNILRRTLSTLNEIANDNDSDGGGDMFLYTCVCQ